MISNISKKGFVQNVNMQKTKTLIAQSVTFLNKSFIRRIDQGNAQGAKKAIVTTFAGDGMPGLANGPALKSKFKSPLDVAVTKEGAIYVADGFNSCVRKIINGEVSTFAGNGNANIKDGTGAGARFKIPSRLTEDVSGNLYLLDAADPRIRKINPDADVSIYAGTSTFGFRDGNVNSARFGQSFGIATDGQRNIYIADSQNDCIRKVSPDGQVTTIAASRKKMPLNGKACIAEFYFVKGIAIDKQGNLFVADLNRIRKITPEGIVSTFAGSGMKGYVHGKWETIGFSQIEDLVMDARENIYISEGNRIHKITCDGIINTIAGGNAGYEDGEASLAKFNEPRGLGIDKQGNLYVADSGNNRIRKISFV